MSTEITLQLNDSLQLGKAKGRKVGPDGQVEGQHNDNPALSSISYDVQFPDGKIREHATNVIAKNLLSRVHEEGFSKEAIKCIADVKKDHSSISLKDILLCSRKGRRQLFKSPMGWKLKVLWNYGKRAWALLKDLKDSNPVDAVDLSSAKGLIKNFPSYGGRHEL